MAMAKAQLETILRNDYLNMVKEMINDKVATDALPVSASELAIPCLDAEGNEKWVLIKVSIPRGTRNGNGYDPYDGYALAEDYAQDCAEKAARKADAEAKKQAKIAKDQKAREEKKALADANKNLKELKKIKLAKAEYELTHEDGHPVEVHFLGKEEDDNYANEYAPHELAEMLN